MAIFSPKNINYLKTTLLSYNFFQICHEPPRCHTHIWLKKRQSCQNYTILWAHEDNRISFFPLFNEKIFALMSIFCKKKRLFSKKHSALMPIFLSKKRPSSQKHGALMSLITFFRKKPMLPCPYLVTKASILSILLYFMG